MARAEPLAGAVEVVYALPHVQRVVALGLPVQGMTAAEAVEQSGLLQQFPELVGRTLVLAVFGTVCEHTRRLRAGDRVEILRPLRHDPRALRRERAAVTPRKGASRR